MAKRVKKSRGFATYHTYLWRDKDPIIDVIRTARSDCRMSYREISDETGVAASTVYGWENGIVRRPMHSTVMAVVNCLVATGKVKAVFRDGRIAITKAQNGSQSKGKVNYKGRVDYRELRV